MMWSAASRPAVLLGALIRFAEGRYAAGGAGVSGATLWDTALASSLRG